MARNDDGEGADPATRARAELAALADDYRAALPGRLQALARAVEETLETGSGASRQEARRLAHRLAGTAASFGFPAVSEAAAELAALLGREPPVSSVLSARIREALRAALAGAGPPGPAG